MVISSSSSQDTLPFVRLEASVSMVVLVAGAAMVAVKTRSSETCAEFSFWQEESRERAAAAARTNVYFIMLPSC